MAAPHSPAMQPASASAAAASPSPAASLVASLSPEQIEAIVYERFMQYSGFGDKTKAGEISNALFAKLCVETGIVNKSCTKTDVDLIFTRAKAKAGRKLNYSQFQMALLYLGEKRFAKTWKEVGPPAAQQKVMDLIAASLGPKANATQPDFVKFYDDKSTFTGVHAKGGPTTVDGHITLSNLMDRSPSDARGRKFT